MEISDFYDRDITIPAAWKQNSIHYLHFTVFLTSVSDPILRRISAYMSNVDKAYDVGITLGLKNHEIEAIREDNSTSIQMSSYQVLQKWKKMGLEKNIDGIQMKQKLIEALNVANLCDCITDLNLEESTVG